MSRRRTDQLAVLLSLVALLCAAPPARAADTEVARADIPVCSGAQQQLWFDATNRSLSLHVADPVGRQILDFPVFERDWFNRDDLVYFPYDSFKTTMCGIMAEFTWHDEWLSDEADWNLNIIPDPFYQQLLQGPAALPSVEDIRTCPCPVGSGLSCSAGDRIDCMQAEVTPDDNVYQNPWFPARTGPSVPDGKRICVYGPWVGDKGHGRRPEIHPAEIIWWRDPIEVGQSYTLLLVHDDSNRFDRKSRGEWYFKDADSAPSVWRPWSATPRRADVHVAFQALAGEAVPKIDVHEFAGLRRHVTTSGSSAISADTDDARHHAPRVDGQLVVEVEELQTVDEDLGVQFSGLCRSADNSRFQGFVSLSARMSRDDNGREGFFPLNLVTTTSGAVYQPPIVAVPPPGLPDLEVDLGDDFLHPGQVSWGDDLVIDATMTFGSAADGGSLSIDGLSIEGPDGETMDLQFELTGGEGGTRIAAVQDLPTLGVRRLVVRSGRQRHTFDFPGHGLWSRYFTAGPYDRSAGPEAWRTIVASLGGQPVEPPASVMATGTAVVELVPKLVPADGDGLEPEGSTAVTRAVAEILAAGESSEIAKMFGTETPFSTTWGELTASDLATGERVAVIQGSGPQAGRVVFEPLAPTEKGLVQLRLHFPDGDAPIEVTVTGVVADPFGSAPEASTTVWSHALRGSAGEGLAEGLLTAAAGMRGLDAGSLVKQSSLGASPADAPVDPAARAARFARLHALEAAEDGLVTPGEIETVLAAVSVWGGTK